MTKPFYGKQKNNNFWESKLGKTFKFINTIHLINNINSFIY